MVQNTMEKFDELINIEKKYHCLNNYSIGIDKY